MFSLSSVDSSPAANECSGAARLLPVTFTGMWAYLSKLAPDAISWPKMSASSFDGLAGMYNGLGLATGLEVDSFSGWDAVLVLVVLSKGL